MMHTISQQKRITWFLIVFTVKLSLFLFFAYQFSINFPENLTTRKVFILEGETNSYYTPIETMAEGKEYFFKAPIPGTNSFSYMPSTRRVPGIVPIYYPLLKIFSLETARIWVIIIQFLTSTISVYLLGMLAYYLFESYLSFCIVLLLYSISSFVSIYDHYAISESFSISFLIIGFFFSFKALIQKKNHLYFLGGAFLCWSTFVRPMLGLSFPTMGIIYLISQYKDKQTFSLDFFKKMALFSVTLLCTLSLWTARNYRVAGEFIPLEDNVYKAQRFAYSARLLAIWDLIGAWGGQITRWSPNSMGEYFLSKEDITSQDCFSERMLSSQCSMDSISLLQQNYKKSNDTLLPMDLRIHYAHRVMEQTYRYRKTFKREKPFQYYVVSPIAMAGKFLYFRTVAYLPFPRFAEMSLYHKIIKVYYIFLINLMLLLAAIGAIWILLRGKIKAKLFLLYPLFYTFVIIVIFIASEQRYVAPLYPVFVLYAGYTLSRLLPEDSKAARFLTRL